VIAEMDELLQLRRIKRSDCLRNAVGSSVNPERCALTKDLINDGRTHPLE
jgi:hypothetical protein